MGKTYEIYIYIYGTSTIKLEVSSESHQSKWCFGHSDHSDTGGSSNGGYPQPVSSALKSSDKS